MVDTGVLKCSGGMAPLKHTRPAPLGLCRQGDEAGELVKELVLGLVSKDCVQLSKVKSRMGRY